VQKGEFLLTIASRNSFLEVALKEMDYSRIHVGSKAQIKFYAFPKKKHNGRVIGFKHFAQPYVKTGVNRHSIKAFIQASEPLPHIQNGMSAKVTIEANSESILGRFYHEIL
jgi:hypothetical protein